MTVQEAREKLGVGGLRANPVIPALTDLILTEYEAETLAARLDNVQARELALGTTGLTEDEAYAAARAIAHFIRNVPAYMHASPFIVRTDVAGRKLMAAAGRAVPDAVADHWWELRELGVR